MITKEEFEALGNRCKQIGKPSICSGGMGLYFSKECYISDGEESYFYEYSRSLNGEVSIWDQKLTKCYFDHYKTERWIYTDVIYENSGKIEY